MVCTASGWFPKPQVQWRDLNGEKFLAFSEAHFQDTEGLVVRHRPVGNVICSILNPILGQEEAMAIFVPGQCCSLFLAGLGGVGWGLPEYAGLSWAMFLMGSLAGCRALLPPVLSLEADFPCEPDCA